MKRFIQSRQMSAEVSYSQNEEREDIIRVIWSTGQKGIRDGFGEKFYEELEMTETACDLSRLKNGAPFLGQHEQHISQTLGVVVDARIENGIGYADIRLSKRQELQGLIQDIKDGILKNISVGYRITEFTDVSGPNDNVRTLRATKWCPYEISLVSVPFDSMAQVLRSSEENKNEVQIINPKEVRMTPEEKALLEELLAKKAKEEEEAKAQEKEEVKAEEQTPSEKPEETPTAQASEETEEEKEAKAKKKKEEEEEAERCESIKLAVRSAKLSEEVAQDFITRGLSIKDASDEIFNKLLNKITQNKEEKRQMNKKEMLAEALLNRINARQFAADNSNFYKGATLMTIASELVERRAGETDATFAQRAIASADLTELLANVANKAIAKDGQEKYSYKKIAEEIQLRDFKSTPIVRLAANGLSDKSSETGEYTDTSLVDTGENIQLKDRGALFKISWVALVNDDLGVLTKLPSKAEMMGGQDIEKQLYAHLNANPVMADTKTLFHADHGNIIAEGDVPSVAMVDAAQQLMSAFQDDASNPMDLSIKYLVVPPSLALAAQQVAGSMVAAKSSDFNPYAGKIEVIVSSRIAKVGGKDVWFAVADPQEYAALYYGTLQGQGDSPEVAVEEDFNSKNLKIRISQPSCIKAASFKGIVRVTANPAEVEE